MTTVASIIALSCGGVAVFTVAYVGVATVQGVHVREIPPLSWVVRDMPQTSDIQPSEPPPRSKEPEPSSTPVPPMTAGVLGAFVMPSPFDSRELQSLQQELSARLGEVEDSKRVLEQRARDLDDWQKNLEDRQRELDRMRTQLGSGAAPTSAAGAQPGSVGADDDPATWRAMAPLFEDGEVDEVSAKLASFEPEDAAQILKGLEPERAAALLNALPTPRYKPFLDAWRRAKD